MRCLCGQMMQLAWTCLEPGRIGLPTQLKIWACPETTGCGRIYLEGGGGMAITDTWYKPDLEMAGIED